MSTGDGTDGRWKEIGIAAYFVAVLVALLTFGGVDVIGSAIAPSGKGGSVAFGAFLLGLASGTAVLGVIFLLRRAVLREPPAPPRPTGKVEL